MAKKYDSDIIGWITKGGRRIPIRKSDVKKGKTEQEKENRAWFFGKKGQYYKDYQTKDEMKADIEKEGSKKGVDFLTSESSKRKIQSAVKRSRDRSDTKDVVEEIKSGKHNSAEEYLTKSGRLTPEREKVHDDIIDKTFEGKKVVDGQATMTMLGGGSASGKSSLPANVSAKSDKTSVVLDPDAFKKALPGFEKMSKETEDAAAFYHEESSALSKRAYKEALEKNYNVVYDGTGDGSVSSAKKKIEQARAKGYKVNGEYSTVEVEEALKRNRQRYEDAKARGESPRLPPEARVRAIHKNVTNVAIQTAPLYDDFKLYDNNVPKDSPKILIATAGNGKWLKAVKGREAELKRFLAKGDIDFIIEDGYVIPLIPSK